MPLFSNIIFSFKEVLLLLFFSLSIFFNAFSQQVKFNINDKADFDFGYNFEISAGGYEHSNIIPIGWSKNGLFAFYSKNDASPAEPQPDIKVYDVEKNKLIKTLPVVSDPENFDYETLDKIANTKINKACNDYQIIYLDEANFIRDKKLPKSKNLSHLKLTSKRGLYELSAVGKNGQNIPIKSGKLLKETVNEDLIPSHEEVDYVGYFVHPKDPNLILIVLMHLYTNSGFENANVYKEEWIGYRID